MKSNIIRLWCIYAALTCLHAGLDAQQFYFGADLSYVNEMQDCGAVYYENSVAKDPYEIFAGHHCNLVRLRLWHTPAWYDDLNSGKRYCDFQDVRKSIQRAKESNMKVLLDFHLSDNWADPGKQRVPDAWLAVVDNLPVLKDSLYNYISATLLDLEQEGLLPEMVQIGNETNKGILLSPEDDQSGWVLEWDRNSQLFNAAIQAVRDVEAQTGKDILVAIHIADPETTYWMIPQFISNGVTDFDIIGMSYYWQWHQPTTIEQTGNYIAQLKAAYPSRQVWIFETGYVWTSLNNGDAGNILSLLTPGYTPASPENQRKWLIDLTQEVIDRGGSGVIYWEPAWVSTGCYTQWGQGSHYENATFFDFNENLIDDGGIGFMQHAYENLSAESGAIPDSGVDVLLDSSQRSLILVFSDGAPDGTFLARMVDQGGKEVFTTPIERQGKLSSRYTLELPALSSGIYVVGVWQGDSIVARKKIFVN